MLFAGWDGRVPENREVRPLLALRDPEEHARRRRAWNRAFSTVALKDYELLIDARIRQFVEILTTKLGTPVDLSSWLGWLTYAIDYFVLDSKLMMFEQVRYNERRNVS
jgi:cytochrome P450